MNLINKMHELILKNIRRKQKMLKNKRKKIGILKKYIKICKFWTYESMKLKNFFLTNNK